MTGDRPKKSHLVVKIMIDSGGLKVSSEDHLLYGNIIEKCKLSKLKDIKDKIRNQGNRGIKGFFYATIPKNGKTMVDGVNVVEIKINTEKIQPMEGW